MSLARDLIDAALAADLSQNELRVFLALFRQTLCYGKTADPLNLKRLATLTAIRKDRLAPAIAGVIGKGLFEAQPHPAFEFTYHIPADFLAAYPDGFFVPALPKNGEAFRFSGETSEKWEHTSLYLTTPNLTATTTTPPPKIPPTADSRRGDLPEKASTQELPYPPSFGKQGRKSAARILDGLTPDNARDCLLLLTTAMDAGKVKSPLGYLHQLAQAARSGTLDCSALQAHQQAAQHRTDTDRTAKLRALLDDIRGLDALFAHAGIPMDTLSAAKRAAWITEYNTIRQEVQP
jgi:phage replication O-like protein O